MPQKRRKPAGARVEWTKCDCPSRVSHGMYARCSECGFLYRDTLLVPQSRELTTPYRDKPSYGTYSSRHGG